MDVLNPIFRSLATEELCVETKIKVSVLADQEIEGGVAGSTLMAAQVEVVQR